MFGTKLQGNSIRLFAMSMAITMLCALISVSALHTGAERANATSGWSTPVDVSADAQVGDSESPEIVVDSTGLAIAIWNQWNGAKYVIRASTSQNRRDWSTPVTVSDAGQTRNTFEPQLIVDSTGLVTAVWFRTGGNGISNILYSSRLQRGGSWSTEVRVSSLSESVSSFDMAVDSTGLVTLVWGSNLNGGVISSSTSQSGSPWSSPATLSETGQVANDPKVAVDSGGLATAVWLSTYASSAIIQSSTSQSGQPWSPVTEISDPAYPSEYPQIAVDSSGAVTVIWIKPANGNYVIQARSKVIGEEWQDQDTFNLSDGDGISGDANLAVNSSGLVAVIWTSWNRIDTEIVQVRTMESPGEWSPTADLTQDHPGCPSGGVGDCIGIPQVIVDSSGGITALWSRCDSYCPIESSYSDSAGEWSTPIALSEAGGEGWDPSSTVDSTGLVTAVWQLYDNSENSQVIQASSISHDVQNSPPPTPPSGGDNSVRSSAEPPVKEQPLQEPKLKGQAKVSAVLSVSKQIKIGDSTAKLTYRWYACSKEIEEAGNKAPKSCNVIKGAKKRKFKLTEKQVGKFVSVMVISASDGNAPTKLMSKSSDRVG